MTAKVVDASALAALLFGKPEAEAVAGQLTNAHLVALALLGHEFANVCLVKIRRQPAEGVAMKAAFGLQARMDLQTIEVDHTGVLELAQATKLTAYDASYLWLARQLGAELVTLDGQLAKAASTP